MGYGEWVQGRGEGKEEWVIRKGIMRRKGRRKGKIVGKRRM